MSDLRAVPSLDQIVSTLRLRPRMLLPDTRYASFVSFFAGYDAGTDGTLFTAFQAWISSKLDSPRSSMHWSALLRDRFPGDENEAEAIAALLAHLDEFLRIHERG